MGGALLAIVGVQIVGLGLCAHAYGTYFMGERDPWFDRMRARFRLEHGLMLGAPCCSPAWRWAIVIFVTWAQRGFGELAEQRLAVLAAALAIIGVQIVFSSFLISILGLRRRG